MTDLQKYKNLEYQLNIVKKKMMKLNREHDKLFFEIKTNIIINDKVMDEESFKEVSINYNNIVNEINEIIIPEINNKL